MKILIADDHTAVRRGLQEIIAEQFPSAIFGAASTGAEVFQVARAEKWSVIVLDINLPDMNGLAVLTEMHQLYPTLPVLIMTMYPEEQYALRALRSGAMGYLTKDSAPGELVIAIKHLIKGRRYISPSLAEHLAGQLVSPKTCRPHETFSDREFRVFQLIITGNKPTQIANELALSVKTISTYRMRIFEKMSMKSDSELIRYAIREGLLDCD